MKYNKELHDWVKSNNVLCEHAGLATVTYTTAVITALLDEIERLQEVEKHLTGNIDVLMQIIDSLQAENERLSGWVDNVCKTAKCWSIYPPPPESE